MISRPAHAGDEVSEPVRRKIGSERKVGSLDNE